MCHGEHQVASVWRDTWEGGTAVNSCGVKHHLTRTELTGFRIKRLLIDAVLQLLVTFLYLHIFLHRSILAFKVCTAIIERLSVGCPCWEHLKLCVAVLKVGHLVSLHIVCNNVAFLVIHLHLIGVGYVEVLHSLVCSIDNEVEPWVPGRINTCREYRVIAHVHLLQFAIISNHRTT